MMKVSHFLPFLLALLFCGSGAQAADGRASLRVGVMAAGTITLTIPALTGNSTTGLGTPSASTSWGTMGRWSGTAPAGVSVLRFTATQWQLRGWLTVRATKSGLNSTTYSVTAQLASAPPAGVTWTLGSVQLSDTTAKMVQSANPYDSNWQLELKLSIMNTAVPGSMSNTINLVAVSN